MEEPNSLGNVARLTALVGAVGNGGGLHQIQELIASYTKLDITTIAFILAFFGTISTALESLRGGAFKIYSWITEFFTASVSIAGNDRLNREVLNWVGANILDRQDTRILTARTEMTSNDAHLYGALGLGGLGFPRRSRSGRSLQSADSAKSMPIQYLPTFGTTWFIHNRNLFLVKRVGSVVRKGVDEFHGVAEGLEPLVVTCFGRSVAPIKRFLDTCRNFGAKQRESFTTIRSSQGVSAYSGEWGSTVLKPLRPLETVHFDETLKQDLVADMRKYLDPKTRKFYTSRGIPYRRGYLLYGTPGTGKTSLSTALAGLFGLDLYMIHLPSIGGDARLAMMFACLPARCIVLLEDIDAIGVERTAIQGSNNPASKRNHTYDQYGDTMPPEPPRCTLSGLLNVLDGVASQEGRIVIMTTNHEDKLDRALIRPGRIDKRVYLGYISPNSAELMFLRMYAPEPDSPPSPDLPNVEIKTLASEFGKKLQDASLTPAQVQGYLLDHIEFPARAVEEITEWMAEEKVRLEKKKLRMEEEKKREMEEEKRLQEESLKLEEMAAKDTSTAMNGNIANVQTLNGAGPFTGMSNSSMANMLPNDVWHPKFVGGNGLEAPKHMENLMVKTNTEKFGLSGKSAKQESEQTSGAEEDKKGGELKTVESEISETA